MKGKLIVIEGTDGSGKSTLAKRICKNFNAVYYREPGSTDVGSKIRDILLHQSVCQQTEALLFAASRQEFVNRELIPALESGKNVVLDRYYYSSVIYQGLGEGNDVNWIKEINCIDKLPDPDLVIVLDPVFDSVAEIANKDVIESKPKSSYTRVEEGYRHFLSYFPNENADIISFIEEDRDRVFERVSSVVEEVL